MRAVALLAAVLGLALAAAGCGGSEADAPPPPRPPVPVESAPTATAPPEPTPAPTESAPAPSGLEAPDVAQIVCADGGAAVITTRVRARADGLHVRAANDRTEAVILELAGPDLSGASQQVDGGAGLELRYPAAPGGVSVICRAALSGEPVGEPATLEVVEVPDGPSRFPCTFAGGVQQTPARDDTGTPGEPDAAARALYPDRIEDADVIEVIARTERQAVVHVFRDRAPLLSVALVTAQDGGWLATSLAQCAPPADAAGTGAATDTGS